MHHDNLAGRGNTPHWYIDNRLDALETPPHCEVWRSTNQSIANDTETLVSFDTTVEDASSMFSGGKVNIATAGLYLMVFRASFDYNATGYREVSFRQNATGVVYDRRLPTQYATLSVVTAVLRCAAGDQLEVAVRQNSGGSLNLLTASYASRFTVTRIGG